MKRLLLIGAIVVASLVAIMVLRNRFGMEMFSITSKSGMDLVIVNDSSDSISAEYREGDKGESPVIQPGDSISGGQGFIRIFTANKAGSYEIEYAYPRPADAPQQITLSQIVAAARKEKFDDAIMLKEGMIGDIKVEYEEALELDVTY